MTLVITITSLHGKTCVGVFKHPHTQALYGGLEYESKFIYIFLKGNRMAENHFNIKVSVDYEIDWERVKDLLISAFEGGSNYWCMIDNENHPYDGNPADAIVDKGQTIWIDEQPDDFLPEDEEEIVHLGKINREIIQERMKKFAEDHQWHFRNFIEENDDSETGDVFLQVMVMGDVVYG